jgi:hypothetical protein
MFVEKKVDQKTKGFKDRTREVACAQVRSGEVNWNPYK